MHTRICRMCGKPFAAEKTEAVYCPDCSPKARAATVIRERTCMDCGAVFPGGPRARRCPDCRKTASREATRKYRASGGASRPIGSVDLCARCGAPIMGSTPSNTCSDACLAIRKRERLAKNQAAYRQRKKEAADNAD